MNIGEQIKKYRKESDMTQKELAEYIGASTGYIQMLELGAKKNPSLDIIEKISKMLNISLPELLGYEAQPEPDILIFYDIKKFTTEELLKEIVRRIS